MKDYLIGYFGGNHDMTPEEGQAHRAKWMEWVAGLGDRAIVPGQPLANTEQIGPGVDVPMMGYAVVRAASIDEAREIANSDPFLSMGGTIQLSELVRMPG